MIALNGLVGLSLMLGGLRYRDSITTSRVSCLPERDHGLAVLGLVLQISLFDERPNLFPEQEISLRRCRRCFTRSFCSPNATTPWLLPGCKETATKHSPHHLARIRSTGFHALMMLLYLAAVIFLLRNSPFPWETASINSHPQAFGGRSSLRWCLSPEGLGGSR